MIVKDYWKRVYLLKGRTFTVIEYVSHFHKVNIVDYVTRNDELNSMMDNGYITYTSLTFTFTDKFIEWVENEKE